MTFRPMTVAALAGLLALAAALAGCAAPEENREAGLGDDGEPCTPGSRQGGESGHENGTVGSGTGDITTADGGDPSRSDSDPSSVAQCTPVAGGGQAGDGASTGLGEPGGGFSTGPE